jgi:hypothetical protein
MRIFQPARSACLVAAARARAMSVTTHAVGLSAPGTSQSSSLSISLTS